MPFYKDAMSHGNLYIKFSVTFPKKGELKDAQIKELQKVIIKNVKSYLICIKIDFTWSQNSTDSKERKC